MRLLVVLVVGMVLALPGTAAARGAYLHLSEANALAGKVKAKTNGVVFLAPCERTSSQSASCRMTQLFSRGEVRCSFTIHVVKWREGRRVRWRADAGRSVCLYVGGSRPGGP